ncbi:hypothetical protein AB0K15_41590 [Amycolatopsis sp. NPDC049253]|uniref:hypothetical protein n=1 Tax=Amycolatopsis sp. NPDC049253 TaxID=3155274 RepID=UPI0034269448
MTEHVGPRRWWTSDRLVGWDGFDLRGQAARLGLPAGWLLDRAERGSGEGAPQRADCQGIPGGQ